LPESTVRASDLRDLERWAAKRRKAPLKHMGVDEIHMGKKVKFITVVSNLETGEPLWFGRERKKETLDEFFQTQLRSSQRRNIEAACVDMWQPFTDSIAQWAGEWRIVYDKFHIMQHANEAVNEVRRAEFFRKGGRLREIVKGKRWLLPTRWVNLNGKKKQLLNELFKLNRRGDEGSLTLCARLSVTHGAPPFGRLLLRAGAFSIIRAQAFPLKRTTLCLVVGLTSLHGSGWGTLSVRVSP